MIDAVKESESAGKQMSERKRHQTTIMVERQTNKVGKTEQRPQRCFCQWYLVNKFKYGPQKKKYRMEEAFAGLCDEYQIL